MAPAIADILHPAGGRHKTSGDHDAVLGTGDGSCYKSGPMSALRRGFLLLCTLGGVLLAIYASLLIRHWGSNAVQPGDVAEARRSAERWILERRTELIREQNNPMLWWMIGRSASLTGSEELAALVDEYRRHLLADDPGTAWRALFEPGYRPALADADVRSLPDYQQLFQLGLSCDASLREQPDIRVQLAPGYCYVDQWRSPTCTTHQLMGVRLLRDRACAVGAPAGLIDVLADRVSSQLRWDPRRVDLNLQRALLVVEERGAEALPGGIVSGVLDARQPDGGWGDFDPLVHLGGGRYLGFAGHGIRISAPRSSFHATAQALLLLTQLEFPRSGPRPTAP